MSREDAFNYFFVAGVCKVGECLSDMNR